MRHLVSAVSLFSMLLAVSGLTAQQINTNAVPSLIQYSGKLPQPSSGSASSKVTGVTFALYKEQEGGAPIWMETQNVTLDVNGHYSVLLGSTRAEGLPTDLFSAQEERWLGVQVQGQAEQARILLVSVPYAMKAAEADRLAGHSVSEFVTTDNLQSAVQEQLQQQTAKGASGTAVIASGLTPNEVSPGLANLATNFADTTTNQVVSVLQNGTGMGLTARSPSNVAILGTLNYIAKPGVVAGVEGTSAVNNGYGMFGYSAATSGGIGIHGRSDSSNGIGLQGWAIGTGGIAINATESSTSGSPIGLVARVSAPNATGAFITNVSGTTVTGPLINATTTLGGTQFTVSGNGNVSAAGTFSGTRLISTVADGTAPLQVASTTLVPNLNASLLGGNKAGAFAPASGSSSYIQNGTSQQAGASFSISGDGGVGGNLFVGGIYSSTGYGIGLDKVLTTGDYNDENVFLGVRAGLNNVVGAGRLNTFSGWDAGGANTTGNKNTFLGHTAGATNSVGARNTFLGAGAGESNTTGSNNVFSGYAAGPSSISGDGNVFDGVSSGLNNSIGAYNAFVGFQAGETNTTGSNNTYVGTDAGDQNNTGSFNVAIGYYAGTNNTGGSDNIYIGNAGANESDTIRIGTNQSQVTYIAGIYNTSNFFGVPVNVDSSGKLGIGLSSRRFKEQIRDMGDSTNALMKLRPVTFLYKPEYDKGPRTLQYGLIAEEVAEVYPELVAFGEDGKPYTVKYQYLATMLLNEVQKQQHRAEAEAEVIKAQQQEIDGLKTQLRLQNATMQERLTRLESLVERQTQTAVNLGQK